MQNSTQYEKFFEVLRRRFQEHVERHLSLSWQDVENALRNKQPALTRVYAMEKTGGEPDVVSYDDRYDQFIFFDCSAESPVGRRSLCYDEAAFNSRKENKPKGSAVGMAQRMGITVLTEEQYRYLQTLGKFDTKTSSWLLTPSSIRDLGGAIFGDKRYDTVFIYHNGAESYYASRGFRGCVRV